MGRKWFVLISILILLTGCTNAAAERQMIKGHGNMPEERGGMMQQNHMQGHMSHDQDMELSNSTGVNELVIPPILTKSENKDFDYEVVAQKGEMDFFKKSATETYGYNGSILGPTVRLQQNETVKVKVGNELDEPTTFHWHGLEVPGSADGGPHQEVLPGESKIVTLQANKEAATLWYHPHPHELTAKQVYKGLGGMLYIDEKSDAQQLPKEYGVDDVPIILQDRLFDHDGQLNYKMLMNSDGTLGDISLINGTMNPKLTITKPIMRFRILNGSNARNYTIKLNNDKKFTQIAGDGGFLTKPIELSELTLSPSERAEIIIDFSKMDTTKQITMIDENGTSLLPFDLNMNEGLNQEGFSVQSKEKFISDEERNLPVSKEVELFGMMQMVTINGKKYDPNRIDFRQEQGVTEVWEVYNKPDMMGGMIHPFHIHGTQFKILSRDGEEAPSNEQGLKDSVLINPGERVKLLVTFPEKGIYMYHCHILEHEDNGMMGQVEVY